MENERCFPQCRVRRRNGGDLSLGYIGECGGYSCNLFTQPSQSGAAPFAANVPQREAALGRSQAKRRDPIEASGCALQDNVRMVDIGIDGINHVDGNGDYRPIATGPRCPLKLMQQLIKYRPAVCAEIDKGNIKQDLLIDLLPCRLWPLHPNDTPANGIHG